MHQHTTTGKSLDGSGMVKTRDAHDSCFIRAQVHRLMKNNEAAMKDLDKVISTLGKGQPSILRQVSLITISTYYQC